MVKQTNKILRIPILYSTLYRLQNIPYGLKNPFPLHGYLFLYITSEEFLHFQVKMLIYPFEIPRFNRLFPKISDLYTGNFLKLTTVRRISKCDLSYSQQKRRHLCFSIEFTKLDVFFF